MRSRRAATAIAAVLVAASAGCGIRMFDRWDGRGGAVLEVEAAPDVVWDRVNDEVARLGLIVEETRAEDRLIQLAWVTAPGDGRQYLRCANAGNVGSASLRPRVQVRTGPGGTAITITSEARATVAAPCQSTGRYESWLLERFAPAVAGAGAAPRVRTAPDRR